MASLTDNGFDKLLFRASPLFDALSYTPDSGSVQGFNFNQLGTGLGTTTADQPITGGTTAENVFSGSLADILYSGKKSFTDTTSGYRMGIDPASKTFKFVMGSSTSSIDWNVTATGVFTIKGSLTATSGTIGGWTINTSSLTATGVTLSSAGNASIAFGTTPPTSPTVGTGVYMDQTGVFGLSANTQNFKLDATNGNITSIAGTIAAFTIAGTTLSATNLTLTSGAANTANITVGTGANAGGLNSANAAGDIIFWGGSTFANRATAAFNVTGAGAVSCSNITITGGSISTTPISGIPNNSSTDISLLTFSQNLSFTSASATQVNWSTGTIIFSNGRSFSITPASNTGSMAALTYIYLDTGVSSTALQTTTTYSTAMGANKALIAVAQNNAVGASVITYGGGQPILDGAGNIVALSITTGSLAAASVTAAKISVSQLSAIAADMGTLTTGQINMSSGTSNIRSGQTAYNTGTGFFLEYNGGTPRFSIGDAGSNRMTWDGTTLSASNVTVLGTLNISTAGVIKSGQSAYNTGTGFWMEYNAGTPRFSIGVAGSNALTFDGTNVDLVGGRIRSIPNDSSTDISMLEIVHNLTFTSASATQINWASGTIKLSNGRTFSISSGNTGTMAAFTYIYLDTGASSTVLQTTTTYSTAMGANKLLLGTAVNNAVAATFTPYNGGGTPILEVPNIQIFTANGTWTKPTNANFVRVVCVGAGGGGGGGAKTGSGWGGTGGGGGAYIERTFKASDLTATVAITIGAGGAGGITAAAGSVGGNSTFGTYLTGYGGGGGYGANNQANNETGGTGGGTGGAGVAGTSTLSNQAGGAPGNSSTLNSSGGQGAGAQPGTAGYNAEFGGGSGGGQAGGAGLVGGSSIYGAGAGGSGGSTGQQLGAAGGNVNSYTSGGGGGGGAANSAGTAGTDGTTIVCGTGGGGGGGGNPGEPGNGGNGGAIGGGGGGGGGSNNSANGGTGGTGGRGEIRVYTT